MRKSGQGTTLRTTRGVVLTVYPLSRSDSAIPITRVNGIYKLRAHAHRHGGSMGA